MNTQITSGITLLELTITMSLIAILSTLAVTNYINMEDEAKVAMTMKSLFEIKVIVRGDERVNGQKGYLSDMGRYPIDLAELIHKGTQPEFNPFNKKGWHGPYISPQATHATLDAWGTPYAYNNVTFELKSCGPNKICETALNSDDISIKLNQD